MMTSSEWVRNPGLIPSLGSTLHETTSPNHWRGQQPWVGQALSRPWSVKRPFIHRFHRGEANAGQKHP